MHFCTVYVRGGHWFGDLAQGRMAHLNDWMNAHGARLSCVPVLIKSETGESLIPLRHRQGARPRVLSAVCVLLVVHRSQRQ